MSYRLLLFWVLWRYHFWQNLASPDLLNSINKALKCISSTIKTVLISRWAFPSTGKFLDLFRLGPGVRIKDFNVTNADNAPEAVWGADPLEEIGGFRSIDSDSQKSFPSSLCPGGYAKWSSLFPSDIEHWDSTVRAIFEVGFPEVDWTSLQAVYGWVALQYQAWARGELVVQGGEIQNVVFYTDNVLEFYIDGDSYFGGDFYALRKAPLVIRLRPGPHRVDVRLVRDVRAMGGSSGPDFTIELRAEKSQSTLSVMSDKMVTSDVVSGRLVSPYASVFVRNNSISRIELTDIKSIKVGKKFVALSKVSQVP